MAKKWIDLDEEIELLDFNDDYIYVHLGIQTIDPSLIVALSRELDPDRLNNIREKIKENGWIDRSPRDLNLLLMPNGTYAVANGGNHRAVASNEFGIKEIKADIGTYIPKSKFTESELKIINDKEDEQTVLSKILRGTKDFDEKDELYNKLSEISKAIEAIKLEVYYRK